ncbi:MAG: hypothetical protein WDM77_03065 [Steroidobacteraceae bacterium]
MRRQRLGFFRLRQLDHAQESRGHVHEVLTLLLRLVEGPLVIRLGAVNDCGGVGAVRGNRDEGQHDADHAHHDADALGEAIAAALMLV